MKSHASKKKTRVTPHNKKKKKTKPKKKKKVSQHNAIYARFTREKFWLVRDGSNNWILIVKPSVLSYFKTFDIKADKSS